MMEKKKLCKCCTAGWLLCVIGGISIPVVSYFIKKQVEKTVIIKKGGVLYDLWKETPIPIYMQFYMFNVTNVYEILNGGKPYVTQKGPYTYIEKREKFNITFHPNGTVSYRQKRIFIFDRSKSVGDDTDIFVTANPLYWTVLAAIKYEYLDINKILEWVLKVGGEGPFFEKSVRELVWGYKDKMLEAGNIIAPKWFYTDFVGYFMNKNNTDDGVYTIFTGEKDITMLGMIDRYNGSSYLNFWSTKSANMVNGTDGTLGPPYLSEDRTLYLFASDICRSVSGEWTSNVKVKDISLRRYTAGFMYLANATINPENIGFCTPESNCMDTGLVNISTCQLSKYPDNIGFCTPESNCMDTGLVNISTCQLSKYPDNIGFCTPESNCIDTGLVNITTCQLSKYPDNIGFCTPESICMDTGLVNISTCQLSKYPDNIGFCTPESNCMDTGLVNISTCQLSKYPDNIGFCTPESNCMDTGLVNISTCQLSKYPDNIGFCTPESNCMDTGLVNISTCQLSKYPDNIGFCTPESNCMDTGLVNISTCQLSKYPDNIGFCTPESNCMDTGLVNISTCQLSKYTDNIGFCTPESNCMDTGLVNISICQLVDYFHIPAVVSMPHFYMASDRIKHSIGGLSPSAEEHQTFVDLEHNTGLVLSVAKRLQINLYIQPVDGIPETSKLLPSVLPVFWLNETAVVNDKYANQLKRMLFIPKLVVEVVQITMLCGGALLLLISVFYGVYKLRENQMIFMKPGDKRLSSLTETDDRRHLVS
ncbi:SCARB2 [Mytilus coruscus]|uniref:SCARB2 n=1 Tax=Mytilus coruscus TaxID=42192 RepID=A0A6J8EGL5_MYTCO|nr:unnamed protein product [Mytilus coruscus]CAC5419754.1 SCARB2 [Mytilus coruscus]